MSEYPSSAQHTSSLAAQPLAQLGLISSVLFKYPSPLYPSTFYCLIDRRMSVIDFHYMAMYDMSFFKWDPCRQDPLLTLSGHNGIVYGVSWSPQLPAVILSCAGKFMGLALSYVDMHLSRP